MLEMHKRRAGVLMYLFWGNAGNRGCLSISTDTEDSNKKGTEQSFDLHVEKQVVYQDKRRWLKSGEDGS